MTGYRSGFVAGDPELIAALRAFRPTVGTAPQEFVQRAAIAAWGDEGHVERTRDAYGRKREILLRGAAREGDPCRGRRGDDVPVARGARRRLLRGLRDRAARARRRRRARASSSGPPARGTSESRSCRPRTSAAAPPRSSGRRCDAWRRRSRRSTGASCRVAEKRGDEWVVNVEAKQAILDYFGLRRIEPQELGPFEYPDKIPLKHGYAALGVRVVPPATARYGAFLSEGVVLMPSYVNIGAWVGPRTMVDTWATVGSCAQIGADVHLAGGVGIGGVLEPVQASPVIVEDGAFIGSRCILTEGVRIGERAVLAPNVVADRLGARDRRDRARAGRVPGLRAAVRRRRARVRARRSFRRARTRWRAR